MSLFDLFKKKPTGHIAAETTDGTLHPEVLRIVAEEIPFLSSDERVEVYRLLEEQAPEGGFTTIESLPARVRELLDL